MVEPGALDDDGAVLLSQEIAREIEQRARVPGPDQGHRHPRVARGRVRAVSAGAARRGARDGVERPWPGRGDRGRPSSGSTTTRRCRAASRPDGQTSFRWPRRPTGCARIRLAGPRSSGSAGRPRPAAASRLGRRTATGRDPGSSATVDLVWKPRGAGRGLARRPAAMRAATARALGGRRSRPLGRIEDSLAGRPSLLGDALTGRVDGVRVPGVAVSAAAARRPRPLLPRRAREAMPVARPRRTPA